MKIHVLGVCGTFMAGVARLAVEQGHEVSGSDRAFFEPMAAQLADAGVERCEGYEASCAERPADLYLVGNAISRGAPLLEDILATGADYASGPAWLAAGVLPGVGKVVAVAGTHGKTTTAAMIVHILAGAGLDPGHVVGGALGAGRPSAALGAGQVMVVEADEYDTAFFDKRPKFVHYWADVQVIGNIEFDHVDIYPDLAAVKRQFALLPRSLKPGGTLVANWADPAVRELFAQQSWHGIERFGAAPGWRCEDARLVDPAGAVCELPSGLPPGRHNEMNLLAAVAACAQLGVPAETALKAMAGFELPGRRMELIFDDGRCKVIDDFAHHPTAMALTIEAVAQRYPDARVVVLFEPRSNTMRAGHWASRLADSLSGADRVLALGESLQWDLAAALAPLGDRAAVYDDSARLAQDAVEQSRASDVLLLLSNGDFAGLRTKLPQRLRALAGGHKG